MQICLLRSEGIDRFTFVIACHGYWKISFLPQPAITCSKLIIGTLEQGVKYAQS